MSLAVTAVLAVVALVTGFGILLVVIGLVVDRPSAPAAHAGAVAAGLGLETAMSPTPAPAQAEAAAPAPLWRRLTHFVRPAARRLEQQRAESGRPTVRSVLASADIKLREDEYLVIEIACGLVLAILAALRFGIGWQVLVAGIVGWLVPGLYVRFRQHRRRRAFEQQLGETLLLLASSLRAGQSLSQAIDNIATSMRPPVAVEFDRAGREIALGLSIEEALANILHRLPSRDFELFVTAVAIQYRSGGNLAEVLEGIAGTIAERVALKGEIATLTAQARASGVIISLLPIAVVVFMYLITPAYFVPMLRSGLGIALLVVAGVLIVVGNLLIRRIVNIEGVR